MKRRKPAARRHVSTPLGRRTPQLRMNPFRAKPNHHATAGDYMALYDFAPAIHLLLDTVGIILDINESGARLLAATRQQLIELPFRSVVAEEHRREFLDHLRRCRMSDEMVESEIRLLARDRSLIPVRVYSRRATLSGRRVCPTVAIDLTELRTLDQALQSAERQRDRAEREREIARAGEAARDRLLAMVSHELRNPLSPVMVAADNLAGWPGLPDRARQLVSVIKRNVELEARLIDDLLDLARVTRGKLELDLDTADVHAVILEAVNASAPAAEAKRVSVTLDLQAESSHARVDSARLRQVFWNLLNNAIKFSDPGQPVIVRTRNDGSTVRISVRDQGVGMDDESLTQIFSPFAERREGTRHRGGLGLGLSISRGIVESHGGQIWASSDGAGKGSTFEVELVTCPAAPVAQPLPERLRPASDPIPAPVHQATDERRGRVLVVEDHHDTGALMAMFLSQHGYEVTLAQTLRDALRELDRDWDVVLSDIGLSDGSGLELAETARMMKNRPGKMIALTGYGTSTDRAASEAAGFDEHLVKPVDLGKLLAALEDIPVVSRNRA